MADLVKTSLWNRHQQLGAKMVPFGSWTMPIQYESVLAEHNWVRSECGVFDVSHMGEFFFRGADAQKALQFLCVNDLERLADGQGQYTAFCTPEGGIIDDLIVYRLSAQEYLLCVNASRTAQDLDWCKSQTSSFQNLNIEDESSSWSQIAVQGPKSSEVIENSPFKGALELGYMQIKSVTWQNETCWIARTGYTGEKGFEIYLPNSLVDELWTQLLEQNPGVLKPIGLGARDSLRLEACYPLYGNDLAESINPFEAGIGWAVRLDKGDFIGREALERAKANPSRKSYGFLMQEPGVPRADMEVLLGEEVIGRVTSGGVLPTLKEKGGLMLLDDTKLQPGQVLEVNIRGKRRKATLSRKPLYSAKTKS